jgi:hypothetical protein
MHACLMYAALAEANTCTLDLATSPHKAMYNASVEQILDTWVPTACPKKNWCGATTVSDHIDLKSFEKDFHGWE